MRNSFLPLSLAACLMGGSFLPAQSRNVTLLSHVNKHGRYNDCWGYVAPNGTEYALLGTTTGLSILNLKNPSKPVEVGFFRGATSTWRDIKTYKNYVYVVTEARGVGMRIFDMSKPDSPRLVNSGWGRSIYRNCHDIYIDTKEGVAYLCGTNVGMVVADVRANPVNPKYLMTWRGNYIHDLHVQDGYAHVAEIYVNRYHILDVRGVRNTPPVIKSLGSVRAPGSRYCHNAWATKDNNYAMSTNEAAGGPVGIYDIRNKLAPKLIATFRGNPKGAPSAIPHNVYSRDRVGHMSHYTEGYRTFDISTPSKPVEVGYYDTWSGSSRGYNGDWGCFPFFPSGIVILSDIQSGLYVVRPKSIATKYGKGTAGTGGRTPTMNAFGAAYLGNPSFALHVANAKPNSGGVLVVGGKAGNLNISGLTINVELFNPSPILIAAGTNSQGIAHLNAPIPSSSSLNNVVLYSQFLVLDPGGSFGMSGTRGLKLTLFAK